MANKKIRKAVFPVAGLGTRFLPVTKASPKEMLPIVDKPLIQYAVEEAIEAGIEELIFVTSGSKRAIEDYFDRNFELENLLEKKGKLKDLAYVKQIVPDHINIVYTRQAEALGLGHAVLCAKQLIGNEPFAVLLADDLIYHPSQSCLSQMVEQYHQQQADGVLAIETVEHESIEQYGIVSMDERNLVQSIIEKPKPIDTTSTSAVVGRYILPPSLFDQINLNQLGVGSEVQLTDAIAKLLSSQKIYGHVFQGQRYDCGSKLGYAKANVDFALRHAGLGEVFQAWLNEKKNKTFLNKVQ